MFKSVNGGQLPQRATKFSTAFDVFANDDAVIGAGETKLIGLGICLDLEEWIDANNISDIAIDDINESYYFELHPRSSLRAKGLGGGVGIIDMDYNLEIKMVISNPMHMSDIGMYNISQRNSELAIGNTFKISKGDKIGQLILKRHEGWMLSSEYTKDEERIGGFGSSGK